MHTSSKLFTKYFLTLSLIISGCTLGQTFEPSTTSLPSSTGTAIPTSTSTQTHIPTDTSTPVPTLMATPAPVCNPGTTVQGAIDDLLPGYIDITKVSTSLDGVMLTVVFSLRELPSQITINKMELRSGVGEIGWGVAIDSDNDPNTGGSSSHSPYGIGYNALLQASHYKTAGGEQTGAIEKLFSDKTNVWEFKPNGHYSVIANGTISIDLQKSKTISLTAKVRNITLQSYLTFYTTYKTNNEQFSDILCER